MHTTKIPTDSHDWQRGAETHHISYADHAQIFALMHLTDKVRNQGSGMQLFCNQKDQDTTKPCFDVTVVLNIFFEVTRQRCSEGKKNT